MKWILAGLFLVSDVALAQASNATPEYQQQVMQTPSGQPSTNSAANQGQGNQMMGQMINMAMGATFMAGCSYPYGIQNCVMGALSFAQALMMGGAAGKSGQTAAASSRYTGTPTPSPTPTNSPLPTNTTPGQAAAFNQLVEAGYKFNGDGSIVDPNGKTWKASDFKDAQSMAAAGLSSSQIGSLQSAMDKANALGKEMAEAALNEANVVSMALDGGGGGRSPAGTMDSGSNFDDYLAKLRNPFGLSKGQQAKMVAGKTVTHGDDQIGVGVDDIFKMIHRRYQEKRAENVFIELLPTPGVSATPKVLTQKK